jgi:hypothetical protein
VARGGLGLIWLDPFLVCGPAQLSALRLGDFKPGELDRDRNPKVSVGARSSVPIVYDLLIVRLRLLWYSVDVFGFDCAEPRRERRRLATGFGCGRVNRFVPCT